MPSTKKLLSITNLKKYFPIAKSSIFQRQQFYVRANEEITLDIHEGETFGLVGESGCGKSTLGRVILQLYDQTAGTTMYYGRSRASIAPKYVAQTLKHAEKYRQKLAKCEEKAKRLTEKCDALGDTADFFTIQQKNLAVAEAQTALAHVVKILGGFLAVDTAHGAELLLARARLEEKAAAIGAKIQDLTNLADVLEGEADGSPEKQKKREQKRAAILAKRDALAKMGEQISQQIAKAEQAITEEKQRHLDNPEFAKYEAMLDDGIDLTRLKYSEMRLLRRDLQIIFQDPYSSLNPRMTVGQIIEEGLVTHKFFRHGSPKMRDYILEIMHKCGLQDYMLHRYPHQFSGGQRQRICIARALAVKPQFVVCDECVSALDVSIQSQIINLLQELKEKEHLTYLFISHDLSVVRYISDRIGVMYLGNLVEVASADTIFRDPRHPYTVALLSSIPTTDPDSLTKERIILEGNIPSPIQPPSGCKFHTRCFMACDKCKNVPPPLQEIEEGHFVACHFPERKLDEKGKFLFEVRTTTAQASREENSEDSTGA